MRNIIQSFAEMGEPSIFPVHPRTSKKIAAHEKESFLKKIPSNTKMIEPVGYLDMLVLEEDTKAAAKKVIALIEECEIV